MAALKINVWVYTDPKNKGTFKKFAIVEFPVLDDIRETMTILLDTYVEQLGFQEI